MKYYVEIVSYETDEVVKTIEAYSLHQAEKIERGVEINMNHDDYFTRIVEAK